MADDPTRPVACGIDDKGNEVVSSMCTPTDFAPRAQGMLMPPTIIPIVFVPGIMGTLLRTSGKTKKNVWSPPNSTLMDGLPLLFGSAFRNAAKRQTMWNPDTTEVDDTGPVSVNERTATLLTGPGKTPEERARFRGWGQLHVDSYGEVLNALEEQLAYMLDAKQNPTDFWQKKIIEVKSPEPWGAQKGFVPLTEDELKKASKAAYPVHAVGYNWLKSNRDSGQRLSDEIDKIIDYYSKTMKRNCDKVIVLTHSMGGMVARACSQLNGGSGKILGILHGVQPAIGAPATYKRMRAGFEGLASTVLGRNASECTAVLGNSPGGLELLPTKEYLAEIDSGATRPWLGASNHVDSNGTKLKEPNVTSLGAGNPYETIYADNNPNHWWRLIKEELLDPAKLTATSSITNPNTSGSPVWDSYLRRINKVGAFHDDLTGQYHPVTYAYYAADPKQPSWRQASWSYWNKDVTDPTEGAIKDDDLTGKVNAMVGEQEMVCTMDGPDGIGDGTVPAYSAAAQTAHTVQIFKHEGKAKDHFSYDHQHSYGNEMTQALTLYTIIKIAVTSSLL